MKRCKSSKRGQSLVEYVALTALVAIVSIGTIKVFGNKVRSRLNQITNTFDRSIQQGLKTHSDADDDFPFELPRFPRIPAPFHLPKGF